ncbi:hypothetical protein CFBP3846_P500024 (plasmid) [Pseudomonas syringae pv. avii]|uniref:Uncharacterized protein n=1 Tax=Pseudomonas syringae pv. avii TaxID=663959 RepID=A0ABY1UGW8_PSESX|nr:hypothetical protein CFBP3846_P500024 [Pseudomonas syringae pv. avii]
MPPISNADASRNQGAQVTVLSFLRKDATTGKRGFHTGSEEANGRQGVFRMLDAQNMREQRRKIEPFVLCACE